jgi:hypothetical protein
MADDANQEPGWYWIRSSDSDAEFPIRLREDGYWLLRGRPDSPCLPPSWSIVARIDDLLRDAALINSPQTANFLESVKTEAAHQVKRWGEAHDRGKSAENWYWLIGYLAGKALRAAIDGDRDKALHHTISSAAALLHWHTAIATDASGCGKGDDRDLEEIARFDAEIAREKRP